MALTLVSDNPNPKRGGLKKQGYNMGFAVGIFDKAAGKEPRNFHGMEQTKYNRGYVKGYIDGYLTVVE
jgi:hypothetical protein